MIYFKKVKWKNFLSTGNNFIEYQLDRNHTTLVIMKTVLVNLQC